ncbi:MAG TPA: response regulator [Caulobacteraceae bacterium]|jgi:DNA-binding NarL/FixJ family response regulator|nr:response regulator [Caulobacteraceae bacterium]
MDSTVGASTLTGKRVMIVEDEFLVAMELESELTDQGCVVIGTAGRSAPAFALLEDETPDAVLLDLNLDGETPTALAEALRRRHVPFIVVSGYSSHRLEPAILRDAPRLQKPVRQRELVAALTEAMAA